MSDALKNLAQALTAAAPGDVTLTADWLSTAMQDPGTGVPGGFDAAVAKAFGTPDGAGLAVTLAENSVGPVGEDGFTVTGAGVTLLQHALTGAATLAFDTINAGGKTLLSIEIATKAKGFEWAWLGEAASGKPFSLLPLQDVVMTFDAAAQTAAAVQALAATIAPPDKFKPIVDAVEGLGFPSLNLDITGSLDFTDVDGASVFLPETELVAPFPKIGTETFKKIGTETFKLGELEVGGPSFGVSITGPLDESDGSGGAAALPDLTGIEDGDILPEPDADDDDDDPPFADQMTSVFFFVTLTLEPEGGKPVAYRLTATVSPFTDAGMFTFALVPAPDGDGALFTPETAIRLIGGGSFFEGTPPQLQQFLGGIGLRTLSLSGSSKPKVTLTSIGVTIGADPNVISPEHKYVLLGDPSGKAEFAITDFELDWSAEFGEKTDYSYLITTQFELLPEIFRTPDDKPGGVFDVEITSTYVINASFDGRASVESLFKEIAGIDIGDTFKGGISDIKVNIDVPQARYTFGAVLDVSLNFGPAGGDPIFSLTDGQLNLTAATPRNSAGQKTGKTAYGGSFMGQINVGPIYASTSIVYDNPALSGKTGAPDWKLKFALAQPLDIRAIIDQYFDPGGGFALPDFFDINLTIKTLSFDATIPTATAGKMTYTLSSSFAWNLTLGVLSISSPDTSLLLNFDGKQPKGSQYSGKISTITYFSFLSSDVEVAFAFKKDQQQKWDNTLSITWAGLTATYATQANTLTFSLKNWSLGSLLTEMVKTVTGDPYFALGSPWDLLNKIPLDGLSMTVHLDAKPGEPSITAKYTLPNAIDLGFIKINGLDFARKDGKVNLALDATIPGPLKSIVDSDPNQKDKWDNLLGNGGGEKPKGQSVDDLPSVPGKGNDYFNMPVLVLGQRVGIAGSSTFANTKAVIDALSGKNTPSTTGKQNPISPTADPSSPAGTPYYEARNDWLIAAHLQLLKAGKEWTVDLMVVFADPDLYGLRLALAGEKAKVLGNLVIDILYKKITDDVGLYQIEFTFPDSIRNINIGQFSIVLPQLGIKIYTNGDFVIDIGFPYNMDFTRSFSISTIIFVGPVPIPLTGAAGFYFGKLSSATATQVPTTKLGTFDPVVIFGFGIQLGLGYNFIKGPLKAGFALTVFGIVEGVIATWNPYNGKAIGNGTNLHDNYYFKISGTVGIIGLLYGEINFAIISASLNIKLTLSVTLTYESYQPIPIMVRATVDVSLKVKVDLGIFSFTISLSFSADVSTKFVIHVGDAKAPWIEQKSGGDVTPALLFDVAQAAEWEEAVLFAAPKAVLRDAGKPKLSLIASPQFTVMSDEAATDPKAARGAFVALLAIDAPDATAKEPQQGTSFETLLRDLLPWVVDALRGNVADEVSLADLGTTPVTDDELTDWIKKLSNLAQPPLSFMNYLGFLSSFDVDITVPQTKEQGDKFQNGAALFPMFDGLGMAWDRDGATIADVDLASYATANETYRAKIAELFEKLTAKVGEQTKKPQQMAADADSDDAPSISMAAFVFVDAFNLLARQLLSSGQAALRDYRYPLSQGNSMDAIVNGVNAIAGNAVQMPDVVQANLTTVLSRGLTLSLPVLVRVVQAGQSMDQVVASLAPAQGASVETLIVQNAGVMAVLPGQSLTLNGQPVTTEIGATFETVAKAAGFDNVQQLAAVPNLSDLLKLRPGAVLSQAGLTYAAQDDDTLAHIGDTFAFDAAALFMPAMTENRSQSPLFDAGKTPDVAVPGLTALGLGDIWASILADDQVPQMAGMLTRFMIYGMRLPSGKSAPGLNLSEGFLYPKDQDAYGLYQLIGQQVPVPAYADKDSLSMTLRRADNVGKVNLDFITFNGAPGTSGPALDLSGAYGRLASLVSFTQDGKFVPQPGYEMLSPSQRRPREFSIQSSSNWSAADAAALKVATGDTSTAPADPIIWSLPQALTNAMGQRQFNLAKRFSDPNNPTHDKQLRRQMFAFLPAYRPMLSSTDPGTGKTNRDPVTEMAWATRVELKIRKLPPSPNPAGTDALAGVTYEIIGASPEEALLLERSLSALDALGKPMISGAYLAYEDNSTGSPRLATPATKDYVAFVTQTNLSTETNPAGGGFAMLAVMDEVPVRGIANAPSDLVKLLWEQSTVRSGGYYLTWRDLPSGTGLPDSIFDEDGGAVLTLVVTFDAATLNGRMTNFINAFLTTSLTLQTGTRLSVVGQNSITGSPPILPDDSLDSLSEVFGVGVGPIAETNATIPLATDRLLPIEGAVHLVSRAEAYDGPNKRSPAEILDIVAAHYSKNADPAIQGSDIAKINPGAAVEEGAALFIPTVLRKTIAGDKLGEIAKYYGIETDRLAVSAAAVQGLFGAGPISIDSLTYDVQGGGVDANIGFEITRQAYPAPTEPSDPDYAQDYMFSLYNVVSAGLKGNQWFTANDNALPFGPQDHSEGDQGATRSVQERRAMLAAKGQTETLRYRQSLSVADSAQLNAGTAPSIGGPENPYVGVGALAQLSLEWRDIFGNTTVTPWRVQPEDYPYAKNGQPVPVLYADRLIPLGSWPNLRSNYIYKAQSGGAKLQISLGFEASAYAETATSFTAVSGVPDWQQRARADLSTYLRIWWQLNQNYKGEHLPWIDGPGVTATLRNSFTGGTDEPFTEPDWTSLRALLNGILSYLSKRANGEAATAPGAQTLMRDITFAEVAGENVIPLSLSIAFERPALLVEPMVAGLMNGYKVRSPILPKPDAGAAAGMSGYSDFASKLEEAFEEAGGWSLRVGGGVAAPDETVNGRAQTLFALRLRDPAKNSGAGIHYAIGDQPGFYAPKPLSKSLITGTYKVLSAYDPSDPGNPFTTTREITLTGVDPNVMFDTALKAIDSFLSPAYAVPAFLLQADGTDNPLTSGALGDILNAKQLLADAIAATSKPVLTNAPAAPEVSQSASEKLRQALLNELAPAYEVSAVVGFDVTDVGGVPAGPAGPATLFGQPGRGKKSDAIKDPWSFSTTRFGLGSTALASSGMAFLFNTANKKAQSYVGLDMDVTFTHLEHDRRHVPGIKNYVQSSWISLITGPIVEPLAGGGRIDIPVVLRALPEPPTMQAQSAKPANTDPNTPQQLAQWDFAFDYLYHRAAQDTAFISTGFNRATDTPLGDRGPSQALVRELVEFTTLYPQVSEVLDSTLAGISVEDATNSNSPVHVSAATAVSAFAKLVTELSIVFDAWARPKLKADFADTDALPEVLCEFELVLSPDPKSEDPANSEAKSEIFNLTLNGLTATYDARTGTVSATETEGDKRTFTLPLPRIDVPGFTAKLVAPYAKSALAAWAYYPVEQTDGADGDEHPLSYERALGIPQRTVVYAPLNLFVYQDAWAAIRIERNKYLTPAEQDGKVRTTDYFLFQSPQVQFADPAIPELNYGSFDLDRLAPADGTTADYLNTFFADATDGGLGAPIEVAMEAIYSYALSATPDLPRTVLPVSYLPPTAGVADGSGAPAPVLELAGFVDAWRKETNVTEDGDAAMGFGVKVFSGVANGLSASKQPILSIGTMTLTATKTKL